MVRSVLVASFLLLAAEAVGWPSTLLAGDQALEEIDYVSLAARLLKDGHYDRAENALQQANPRAEHFDSQRYYTLLGMVNLKKKQFKKAAVSFERAIQTQVQQDYRAARDAEDQDDDEGAKPRLPPVEPDPLLLLYLAQAHYGMQDYRGLLQVLERADGALDDEASVHLMRSQAHRELGQPAEALAALRRGERAFPQNGAFARLQVFHLIDLGLYQEAMKRGEQYLQRGDADASDYVAVGEALRKGKQLDKAASVLERARLRFPYDTQVMLALAHVYIDRERPLTAAMLLEQAARFDPRFLVQAAELYKRAGRLSRALSINAGVMDQEEKLEQRLGILLEMERFELVAAMASSLSREGLLDDDSVRYALAYGFYRIGDFNAAERHLKRIRATTWLDNANQLRRAMESCRSSGWECI